MRRERCETVAPLLVDGVRAAELKQEAIALRSLDLAGDALCDLELLLGGACRPLDRYMTRAECEAVSAGHRLPDGQLWPLPLSLPVAEPFGASVRQGERLVLRDPEGAMLAVLTVTDSWPAEGGGWALGGTLEGIALPLHHDHPELRLSADRLREALAQGDARQVLAVDGAETLPTSAHRALAAAAKTLSLSVLLPLAVGGAVATDLALHRRVRACRAALPVYPPGRVRLALLPLSRREGGVRELLWRALVQRNCGADGLLYDPARLTAAGREALRPWLARYEAELGIRLMSAEELGVAPGAFGGEEERVEEAGVVMPRGCTCFFTGLSGAGKSTVASALAARLAALGRSVTLLDGDIVRRHLSSELSFSKEHRDLNIRRIGFVAGEITRHGGIAICAPIAPYRATRAAVRAMVEEAGGFFEIHVATPLAVCEQRDPKGLYAKAHAGLIKDFTGVNDPYEPPERPELTLDTSGIPVEQAVEAVLDLLRAGGYLGGGAAQPFAETMRPAGVGGQQE